MSKDLIGYDGLVDAALRGVVRQALRNIAERGLLGSHHLYVSFRTSDPGVDIPDFLRERYPDEMTIVLQHQYWGLEVTEDRFSVGLSFNKAKCMLTIPYAAITRFADPGVKFGLQFTGAENSIGAVQTNLKAPEALPPKTRPEAAAQRKAPTEASAPDETPAEKVIRLDSFRKK
ncbi:MAG: hypothetical protein EXQ99_07700 [Alphaproteobacteria bacterium]|nr:hypothetical protein [Alphaproteobacteria bacterium]